MWKRFLVRRRSVILTWLLSYMAILTVPILISGFVYSQSQHILKSEIHRANNVLLKEVREVIDNQVQNAERLTTELTWNVRIRSYLYSNLYSAPDSLDSDLYDLHMAAKELTVYQSLYPAVKTYYVYWKNQDLVFEPGVYRNSRLTFDTLHQNDSISYDLWLRLLQEKNTGRFIKLASQDASQSTLAYIQSFPGERLESPPGAAVVLLDPSQLMETIRNVKEFSNGQVLVLNRDGQILLSTAASGNSPYLSGLAFAGESGLTFGEYDGRRSEFMYIKSGNSELVYVTVVPSTLVWQKTDYLRNITYAGTLISILGGLGLTVLFLFRNYSPVQRLLRLLRRDQTATAFAHEGNEFQHIEQALFDTLNEQDQIHLRMKQQSQMLRSNVMARLFKGKLDSRLPPDESLAAFDVRFQSDFFAVILFYTDYEKFFEFVEELDIPDKARWMQFIITNVVEDLAGEKHRGFVCEIDDQMACLINFTPATREQLRADAKSLAERAGQFLREKFNIHTVASISGIRDSASQIPQAYREAVDALEYAVVVGEGPIVVYDEIQREPPPGAQSDYYYPIQVEQQLMNQVKAGDKAGAEATIREIIARNRGQSPLSVELIKCLMFNLISTLIKTVGEIGDVAESSLARNSRRIAELIHCESIREMEERLAVVVQEVCEYALHMQQQRTQSSRHLALQDRIADILVFIEDNYRDANLNISRIGERFGMTPTYLSKLFREHTGQGLLDTINHHRIEHAKTLLRELNDSIKTIAAQVGFQDINTFIRTFKKYEGVTPGQYQKMGKS